MADSPGRPDGPERASGPHRRRLLVGGALILVAGLVLALVLALTGGDDDAPTSPSAAATSTGPTPSGSASPGSASPGSASPGSASSGSASPGSGSSGSATGAPGSTGSPTIPGVVEDPATVPASRVLLCDVSAPRIAALLGPDGAGPDTLRVSSDALLQLLPDWRDGAGGYPLADGRIVLAEQVGAAWERAVAAYDAGDQDAAEDFTRDAETTLAELDELAPLPGC